MFKSNVLKLAAVAAVFALAGCQDLKPMQADIASLKTQVGSLEAALNAHKADKAAEQANAAAAAKADADAKAAAQAAASAQSTANQALSAAQAAQAGVDATNETITRMFKRSVSK